MPNELVAVPSAYASSFAWVDDETYGEYMEAQHGYPAHGANRLYRHLTANIAGGQTGSVRVSAIAAEVQQSATAFLTQYAQNHLNFAAPASTIRNVMGRTRYTAIAALVALRGRTAPNTTVYCNSGANRTSIENQTRTWARTVRDALIEYWLDQIIAPQHAAPALAAQNDNNVGQAAGVACTVHYRQNNAWVQLGNAYVAALHAAGANHAEMQWFTAHDAALGALVDNVDRVDFHISEQPCSAYCARRVIANWAAYGTATPGYIITYHDTDARANVYRLLDNAIVRLT
ncbi:MAG: hypothetical protein QOI58_1635 [Thermoanaerobaculia bacterium]|nr:hypothetical protein [Thermoanaerobaculia bacterium]